MEPYEIEYYFDIVLFCGTKLWQIIIKTIAALLIYIFFSAETKIKLSLIERNLRNVYCNWTHIVQIYTEKKMLKN